MLLLLRSPGTGLSESKAGGGYDDSKKRKKVIVGGKSYRVTPYELDQLLAVEHDKDEQEAAEQATARVINVAKAKPAKKAAKSIESVIAAYDDDADIEDLLMML